MRCREGEEDGSSTGLQAPDSWNLPRLLSWPQRTCSSPGFPGHCCWLLPAVGSGSFATHSLAVWAAVGGIMQGRREEE